MHKTLYNVKGKTKTRDPLAGNKKNFDIHIHLSYTLESLGFRNSIYVLMLYIYTATYWDGTRCFQLLV